MTTTDQAHAAWGELDFDTPVAALGGDDVMGQLQALAHVSSRVDAHRLALVGEFDARGLHRPLGFTRVSRWLADRTSLSNATARMWERDAGRLRSHPVVDAFVPVIGAERARIVLRGTQAKEPGMFDEHAAFLCTEAAKLSVDQTARFIATWLRFANPDGTDPGDRTGTVSISRTAGGIRIVADLGDGLDAIISAEAIEARAREILHEEQRCNDGRALSTPGERNARAFCELLAAGIRNNPNPSPSAQPVININCPIDALGYQTDHHCNCCTHNHDHDGDHAPDDRDRDSTADRDSAPDRDSTRGNAPQPPPERERAETSRRHPAGAGTSDDDRESKGETTSHTASQDTAGPEAEAHSASESGSEFESESDFGAGVDVEDERGEPAEATTGAVHRARRVPPTTEHADRPPAGAATEAPPPPGWAPPWDPGGSQHPPPGSTLHQGPGLWTPDQEPEPPGPNRARRRGHCACGHGHTTRQPKPNPEDIPIETLFGPQARIAGYRALTREELRLLACDAGIARMITDPEGVIIDYGRNERTALPHQRTAVIARDQHCVIPGCEANARYCDIHHIQYWDEHGGPTDLDNLCLLCRAHHTMLHTGLITILGTPGRLTVLRADGTPMDTTPALH